MGGIHIINTQFTVSMFLSVTSVTFYVLSLIIKHYLFVKFQTFW